MWSDIIICNTLNRYFCDMVTRKFQKPGFSGCPMPYLGPYHLPLFKGSPQMLSTGSNRFERWQGNSDIIAFAFLFDTIICRIKIHFLVIMTSSDSVSISVISQDGYVKFHCMNSVELILLKCIPRGHPNPCSRVGFVYKIPYRRALGLAFRPSARASKGILHTSVGLSCSIFKNTSATCAYPLVSSVTSAHMGAQGTFSYTPCSRRGLTKNIYVSIYFS